MIAENKKGLETKNKKQNMDNQLKLDRKDLLQIGFVPVTKSFNGKRRRYWQIDCINSCFSYNPREDKYSWYYTTLIGDVSNHVHMDITTVVQLLLVLQSFKVKYNF